VKINYKGLGSYRLSNAQVELVVTLDVGPRILHFGFAGGPNEFAQFLDTPGGETAIALPVASGEWKMYGGHRFWHAPEANPRSYAPDNSPLTFEERPGFVRVIQPTEITTGLQKEIDIQLWSDAAHARLTHRLRNHNLWPIEVAPWALSVMAPGGVAILPLPPRTLWSDDNLLPTGQLTLWSYTDLSDPRWTLGRQYVLLRQDPQRAEVQKLGLRAPAGWAAYANGGRLFVKTFAYDAQAVYPDLGSPLEVFVCAEFLELETLGPLARLEPGAAVEHVEDWFLFRDVVQPRTEADVEAHVLPKINVTP